MRALLASCALALAAGAAFAQSVSPVGLWKTIDDETKTEKSFVRIVESNGVLSGRVEKIVDPKKQDNVCDECSDDRRGQRVLGMTIVRNMRPSADGPGLWDGGDILDPNNGKVYRARMKPVDDGRVLEVRGYIGPFFRTQRWLRAE